jgi:hypothetical protein
MFASRRAFLLALGGTVIFWIPGAFSADINWHLNDMTNDVLLPTAALLDDESAAAVG